MSSTVHKYYTGCVLVVLDWRAGGWGAPSIKYVVVAAREEDVRPVTNKEPHSVVLIHVKETHRWSNCTKVTGTRSSCWLQREPEHQFSTGGGWGRIMGLVADAFPFPPLFSFQITVISFTATCTISLHFPLKKEKDTCTVQGVLKQLLNNVETSVSKTRSRVHFQA